MIGGMVFDLDGTLVQTERLKALSYAGAAVRLRPELEESVAVDAFKEVVGRSRREVAEHLLERFDLRAAAEEWMDRFDVDTPWQAYVQVRLDIYRTMLADERVIRENQWPHNVALLHHARRTCRRVALATMSHCPQVRRVLRVLGLDETFDFVASRDDVELPKPDPEIYLLSAAEIDLPPAECLVIEDSPTGVRAALAAGMRCIAVATPFTRDGLYADGTLPARWIVDDPARVCEAVDQLIEEERATRDEREMAR